MPKGRIDKFNRHVSALMIWIPDDVYELLWKRAAQSNRSMSSEAALILQRELTGAGPNWLEDDDSA